MAQDDFIDYDVDNDHLTEVSNLAQLNAMRWDGFGNGAPTSADQAAYLEAFPGGNVVTFPKMGCPMTCKGYELTADLDFDTNGNLTANAGDEYWKDGAGWAPIFGQTSGSSFEAIFEGNGHVISNLFINRTTGRNGLFGHIFNGVTVRNVGLVNVDVTGGRQRHRRPGGLCARSLHHLHSQNHPQLRYRQGCRNIPGRRDAPGSYGAGFAPGHGLTFPLTLSGDNANDYTYTPAQPSITIGPWWNRGSTTITITPLNDGRGDGDEPIFIEGATTIRRWYPHNDGTGHGSIGTYTLSHKAQVVLRELPPLPPVANPVARPSLSGDVTASGTGRWKASRPGNIRLVAGESPGRALTYQWEQIVGPQLAGM